MDGVRYNHETKLTIYQVCNKMTYNQTDSTHNKNTYYIFDYWHIITNRYMKCCISTQKISITTFLWSRNNSWQCNVFDPMLYIILLATNNSWIVIDTKEWMNKLSVHLINTPHTRDLLWCICGWVVDCIKGLHQFASQ